MDVLMLGITVISLVVAAVSTTVAWRVTRADRDRRAARIAALAAAAGVAARPHHTPAAEASIAPADLQLPAGVAGDNGLFRAAVADSGSGGRQRLLMGSITALACVVLVVAAAWLVLGRSRGPVHAETRVPLELVALSHARTDGIFAVSGLVRNPATGRAVHALEADVRVFDAAGIMIATKSVTVDAADLAPGQQVPFTLPVGEATTAARYRVTFKSAGTMIPHVDRRVNTPSAVSQTADAR
jgi:hypothetical protein